MRSSILGIYHPGGVFHPSATNNGKFGNLTDHTGEEPRSLSLPKGPHRLGQLRLCGGPVLDFNIHGFPAFAWNDGTGAVCPPAPWSPLPRAIVTFAYAEVQSFFCLCLFFIPCLCLCLFRVIPCSSVANASAFVFFPWLIFCCLLLTFSTFQLIINAKMYFFLST